VARGVDVDLERRGRIVRYLQACFLFLFAMALLRVVFVGEHETK